MAKLSETDKQALRQNQNLLWGSGQFPLQGNMPRAPKNRAKQIVIGLALTMLGIATTLLILVKMAR